MIGNWGTISDHLSLKEVLKSVGIAALGQLHVYKLRKKPIFIFATRRGGSTLAMAMIASQPGVDFCSEPLTLWRAHPHFGLLPHPRRGRFVDLDEDDERLLSRYFEDLLSGNIKAFNDWNPFSPAFSFFVDRLTIKVLNASTLVKWFEEHFDVDVIYLVRHPIAVASSSIRLGWGNDAAAYLENESYCSTHLGSDLADFGRQVLEHGPPLQRYVLEWCLENIQPLRLFQRRSWLILTYEEIIMHPKEMSELICSRFGLPGPRRMRNVVLEASRTTTQHSRRLIKEKGPNALVGRWAQDIDPADAAMAGEVLEAFGIWAYDAQSPWPHPGLCHFGPCGGE